MEAIKSGASRRRVVDVAASKKKPRDEDDDSVRIPLEMMPVIRTLAGYGRRMHGSGALRGAYALEKFSQELVQFLERVPELAAVSAAAAAEAQAIRALALNSLRSGEQPEEED